MQISKDDYIKNGYLLIPNFFESPYAAKIKEKILFFCNQKDNKYAVLKYPEKISRLFSYKFYKKNWFKIKDLDIMLAILKSTSIDNFKNLRDTLGLKKIYLIDSYLSYDDARLILIGASIFWICIAPLFLIYKIHLKNFFLG